MYVDKDSKTLKWRDLTGPEKLQLFKAIDIPQLFPKISHVVKVQELWTKFLEIYLVLQSTTAFDNERVKSFRSRVKNWMTVLLSVYQTKHVTPYMHLLVSHKPQFLDSFVGLHFVLSVHQNI